MTRRSTGPTPAIRDAVYLRDGFACVVCSNTDGPFQIHHRSGRRAGGSRLVSKNALSNLMLVCENDHRWIESFRLLAEERGWIVRSHQDPAVVPLAWHRKRCLLTDLGAVEIVEVAS